jgi:hypothetical protein
MVDLQQVRRKLAEKDVITVSRNWLEEVERDLSELAARRARETRQ